MANLSNESNSRKTLCTSGIFMLPAYVSEELAKKFYSDTDFNIEAKCPYCKKRTEMDHGDDISSFDLPDELLKEVVYPSIGICQRCGKTSLIGHKPLRAKI